MSEVTVQLCNAAVSDSRRNLLDAESRLQQHRARHGHPTYPNVRYEPTPGHLLDEPRQVTGGHVHLAGEALLLKLRVTNLTIESAKDLIQFSDGHRQVARAESKEETMAFVSSDAHKLMNRTGFVGGPIP